MKILFERSPDLQFVWFEIIVIDRGTRVICPWTKPNNYQMEGVHIKVNITVADMSMQVASTLDQKGLWTITKWVWLCFHRGTVYMQGGKFCDSPLKYMSYCTQKFKVCQSNLYLTSYFFFLTFPIKKLAYCWCKNCTEPNCQHYIFWTVNLC